ncbi:MAG TPA: hypothetical protein VL500_05655 [Candidatus Eisenbacteria bacterium]|nr:hypothetical protein [Candidatus Eisenbacteria bacterium]
MDAKTLEARLAPFIRQGLIGRVPTRWQIFQGSVEMLQYVVIPDMDDGRRYAGAPLGHPVVRTPFLVAYTLGGHFNVGSGLGARERSIQKHLLAVHHFGQPVYDLQLAQTHPFGLTKLRRKFTDVRDARTRLLRIERTFVGSIIPSWDEYCEAMHGHIDRAARFDYDAAPAWGRKEFWSLCAFMNHCATAYPPDLAGERPLKLLRRLYRLLTRERPAPPNPP